MQFDPNAAKRASSPHQSLPPSLIHIFPFLAVLSLPSHFKNKISNNIFAVLTMPFFINVQSVGAPCQSHISNRTAQFLGCAMFV